VPSTGTPAGPGVPGRRGPVRHRDPTAGPRNAPYLPFAMFSGACNLVLSVSHTQTNGKQPADDDPTPGNLVIATVHAGEPAGDREPGSPPPVWLPQPARILLAVTQCGSDGKPRHSDASEGLVVPPRQSRVPP